MGQGGGCGATVDSVEVLIGTGGAFGFLSLFNVFELHVVKLAIGGFGDSDEPLSGNWKQKEKNGLAMKII